MAQICKQITVVTEDKVGLLADLTEAIRDAGVNILALCAWAEGGTGHLMAATDDPDAACSAAGPFVTRCSFNEAVCTKIPNEKGQLHEISRTLADAGISIHTVYATGGDAAEVHVVLITSDNAKAAEILP
jgi:hypothetical protein